MKHCHTDDMVADFMTKPVTGEKFFKFRNAIMGMEHGTIIPHKTTKKNPRAIMLDGARKKRPSSQRAPSARAVDCEIDDIIFRSDYSFTIMTETSTLTGQYTIDSETSISLYQGETNIGMLTDIILTENFISFNTFSFF